MNAGGTFASPRAGNAWFEYSNLSNVLESPKILACPADASSDPNLLPAPDFSTLRLSLRERAVSYTLGLHAGRDLSADGVVATDRNLRFDGGPRSCSTGVNNALFVMIHDPNSALSWTNAVHVVGGNLLLFDGSVAFTTTAELRQRLLAPANDEAGEAHFLKAR